MVTAALVVLGIAGFCVLFVVVAKSLYRVVPMNEAHIRVMMSRKAVFCNRKDHKSSYWYVPIITRLHRLPLSNLAVPIDNVKLNDSDMAKFLTDLVCFINIRNLPLAAERLTLTDAKEDLGFNFKKLQEHLVVIMESIGRTVATQQTILDIYKDRAKLDTTITNEIKTVFPEWGIELVDLELKDIKDAPGSSIIADIERKVAAEKTKEAEVKEATMEREAKVKQAEETEIYRKREVNRDREIGLAEQQALLEVAKKKADANAQEVEAARVLEVGKQEIQKQMVEKKAEAEKIKLSVEAEGQRIKLTEEAEGKAQEINREGKAEADIILAKKLAEAEGTEKMALALQLYNDAAIRPKMLEIMRDVQVEKYKNLAQSLEKADLRLIMSGQKAGSLFGLDFNAETGANIDQFLDESGIQGFDMDKIKKGLNKILGQTSEKGNGGVDAES